MRAFELHRIEDETGISGTGHIASGVVFEDGRVTLRWRTERRSSGDYDSIEDVIAIHGHGGKTVIKYVGFVSAPVRKDDVRDWTMLFMCSVCFGADDTDGHCFNCGAGGTTYLAPRWFIDDLRKNGSWVCKRYYANEEDAQNARELRALRERMPEYPGRSAELRTPVPGDGESYWSVKQELPNNLWISITVPWREGDTEHDAIARSRGLLPWNPEVSWAPNSVKR